jgi:Holliday junction DNA helicase RuvB
MLAGYIGQEDRLQALHAAIIAAKATQNRLPNMLIVGKPGVGKTHLAYAIAEEMESDIITVHGPSIMERKNLTDKIMEAEGQILFIEEIHSLNRSLAEDLYSVIDENVITMETPVKRKATVSRYYAEKKSLPAGFEQLWEGAGIYTVSDEVDSDEVTIARVPLAPLTIIGATTDEALLPEAFHSRMSSLKVFLRDYTLIELSTIGTLHADDIGIGLTGEAAMLLANRSRFNPRRMKHLVERSADVAIAVGESEVAAGAAETALEALGVDRLGLEPPHRAILLALRDAGGSMSRTSLGQRLGIPSRNLDYYWGDLISQGLVNVDTRHRLTVDGQNAIT